MGRDSVKLCLRLISVNTECECEKCTHKRQYTQSKCIYSKAMHCVGICVWCRNLIPMQGKSAPDCSTKASVMGQRSDVRDGALMWGEAENIWQLNQPLCPFNWPSFPSIAISLPLLYSVCVIYMESRVKWTHGCLHWHWKRADGLFLFWPPRTLSLDMTDLKDSKDLREQLRYRCVKVTSKKLQYGYILKIKNHMQFLSESFLAFPSFVLDYLACGFLSLRQLGSSGSSHFACYELSVVLLFFPPHSQSLPPNLFFLNMTLLFCEVPTSFSLFVSPRLLWGELLFWGVWHP